MYSKEEAQKMRHDFWHKLESKSRRLPGQNGRPIRWIGNRSGIKGVDLRFDLSQGKVIVGLEVNTHSTERDEALWSKLENCRKMIEAHFEAEVHWKRDFVREAGNTVARVYVMTEGDIYDKEKWADMIHFMLDNMLRLESAYKEIQDYLVHF